MQNLEHLFIEQAEYLPDLDFDKWSLDHPDFNNIFHKISGPGAKLIIGPRGSGKTTILLRSLERINKTRTKRAVYINFKKSLSLEPFYRSNLNPEFCFVQWLLAKTYIAILEASRADISATRAEDARKIAQRLENGVDFMPGTTPLQYTDVFDAAEFLISHTGAERVILLMDDAAHAFSPEQQRDFFEFFRNVKSRKISPKAAIYPGVTAFGPAFQIGHDGQQEDIWTNPLNDAYLIFLRDLLERRLPPPLFQRFANIDGLIDLIAYCSFGIPRNFLNLVKAIYDRSKDKAISPSMVYDAISDSCRRSTDLFLSLKDKLARYSNYVETGERVLSSAVKEIKEYNRNKELHRQSITLALKAPLDENMARVVGFLEYSGLMLPLDKQISRGEKGTFELFYISIAHLVNANAIVGAKSKKVEAFVEAIRRRHAHEFTRVSLDTLLSSVDRDNAFKLALSPCAKCHTLRINEASKFCHNCGAPLTEASVFYELIEKDISALPLTSHRVKTIKAKSNLRSVKDVLNDIDHKQLRSVPQIGEFWAKRIYEYAEEYIS